MKVGKRRSRWKWGKGEGHTQSTLCCWVRNQYMKRDLGLSPCSKQKVLKCLLVLHPCSPLTNICWGKGCKQGMMAAGATGSLWYPGTSVSSPHSFPAQSGALRNPFPTPQSVSQLNDFLSTPFFCPAVFSFFEGITSPWTHYICSSFLLKFFLCMCVTTKIA